MSSLHFPLCPAGKKGGPTKAVPAGIGAAPGRGGELRGVGGTLHDSLTVGRGEGEGMAQPSSLRAGGADTGAVH